MDGYIHGWTDRASERTNEVGSDGQTERASERATEALWLKQRQRAHDGMMFDWSITVVIGVVLIPSAPADDVLTTLNDKLMCWEVMAPR